MNPLKIPPAFWRGFGSVLNLFGDPDRRSFDIPGHPPFRVSRNAEEAARLDAEALAGDWRRILSKIPNQHHDERHPD
jgi:hypothetical protein